MDAGIRTGLSGSLPLGQIHRKRKTKKRELREFGFLMGGMVALIFGIFFPLVLSRPFPIWPWIILAVFYVPALIYPVSLTYVYWAWMKLALILGKVNSTVFLGVIFFLVITPMGIINRIIKGDTLKLKFEPDLHSYRISRRADMDKSNLERPF